MDSPESQDKGLDTGGFLWEVTQEAGGRSWRGKQEDGESQCNKVSLRSLLWTAGLNSLGPLGGTHISLSEESVWKKAGWSI